MTQMGTYAELLTTSALFARLLEDINQHQSDRQSISMTKHVSRKDSVIEEIEEEEEVTSSLENIETKQEGTVKWGVYISYLRAGVNVAIGLFLIIIIFSAQQATDMFGNWWLAQWSNDESHRYAVYSNCTGTIDQKINKIRSMSTNEWTTYRNQRFYTYAGK